MPKPAPECEPAPGRGRGSLKRTSPQVQKLRAYFTSLNSVIANTSKNTGNYHLYLETVLLLQTSASRAAESRSQSVGENPLKSAYMVENTGSWRS
jgi:hypothetical protein